MTNATERPSNEKNLTLTDFLLARIAEDEAFARMGVRIREESTATQMSPMQQAHAAGLVDRVLDDAEAVSLIAGFTESGVRAPGEVERILAECEARRRIVEHCSHDDWTDPQTVSLGEPGEGMLGDVLQLLALPYADHPDYRPDWRVVTPDEARARSEAAARQWRDEHPLVNDGGTIRRP